MRREEPALEHPVHRGVRLSAADGEAGESLSTEAGWNQTLADWNFMLRAGDGFGFEDAGGRLVASALLLPYETRFAWISMVLVSTAARRQGLASLLLRHLLRIGRARRLALLLDASAEGRQVYLPLGFRDLRRITRWTRPGAAPLPAGPVAPDASIVSEAWIDWDAARFGASRGPLLRWMLARPPALARPIPAAPKPPDGFCLGRTGRTATQIGPLVAATETAAQALLAPRLDATTGAAIVDLMDGRPALEALLQRHGFSPQRHFVRMIHGDASEPGRPENIFALTGPEFG